MGDLLTAAKPLPEHAESTEARLLFRSLPVRFFHRLAEFPPVYSALRSAMGGENYWKHLVDNIAGVQPGYRVLDLGCGPARILDHLPETDYVGVDINPHYLAAARRRSGDRPVLVLGSSDKLESVSGPFNVVFAIGLMHHLSDEEVHRTLSSVSAVGSTQTLVVTADVVRYPSASWSARWLTERDRGLFVREESAYLRLMSNYLDLGYHEVSSEFLKVPITRDGFPVLLTASRILSPQFEPRFAEQLEDVSIAS